MLWNKYQVVLGASNSTQTSGDHFVGDMRFITLSLQTSTGSASNVTVSLSNDDGFCAAVAPTSYSVATLLAAAGMYTIDAGGRWLKVERANIAVSAASNATVLLNRTYQS